MHSIPNTDNSGKKKTFFGKTIGNGFQITRYSVFEMVIHKCKLSKQTRLL